MKLLVILAAIAGLSAPSTAPQPRPVHAPVAPMSKACPQKLLASSAPKEGRGCCSWHGGQCGCSGGRVTCCDGTVSPSCGC